MLLFSQVSFYAAYVYRSLRHRPCADADGYELCVGGADDGSSGYPPRGSIPSMGGCLPLEHLPTRMQFASKPSSALSFVSLRSIAVARSVSRGVRLLAPAPPWRPAGSVRRPIRSPHHCFSGVGRPSRPARGSLGVLLAPHSGWLRSRSSVLSHSISAFSWHGCGYSAGGRRAAAMSRMGSALTSHWAQSLRS